MIKRTVFLTILVLALPVASLASASADFSDSTNTLSGTNSGMTLAGSTLVSVDGAALHLTLDTGRGFFDGQTTISSGDTNISTTVPEPGTLGLLGAGLFGVAGSVRRKLKLL